MGWGPSRSSEESRGTLPEVQNGSRNLPGCLGRVGRPSVRFRTGQGTIPKVRDKLRNPPKGPGPVRGPFWRTGMG